eukprot:scaffold100562_cov40-Tisochrysis_lutea.AAC.1
MCARANCRWPWEAPRTSPTSAARSLTLGPTRVFTCVHVSAFCCCCFNVCEASKAGEKHAALSHVFCPSAKSEFSAGEHDDNDVAQGYKTAASGGIIVCVCNYVFMYLWGSEESASEGGVSENKA